MGDWEKYAAGQQGSHAHHVVFTNGARTTVSNCHPSRHTSSPKLTAAPSQQSRALRRKLSSQLVTLGPLPPTKAMFDQTSVPK